ncbi:hypothetical protein ACFWPQ_38280 [Streptomyces sp. NPDC058464]|uniref:hypothetical protein n=1 Tax=Streptomyces sp. NPDC058464 TaxID=3346511 RepID=UPI003657993E
MYGDIYGPFVAAAASRVPNPKIACVVVHPEGDWGTYERAAKALQAAQTCRPVPVMATENDPFTMKRLQDTDGDALFVCAGHTPTYAQALSPYARELREWLRTGARPYGGYSAGAAAAAQVGIVGGWLHDGIRICPEESSEETDELLISSGIGLLDWSVEVHATQWGTLSRAITAVASRLVERAVAIDEDTLLHVVGSAGLVHGLGKVHLITRTDHGTAIVSYRPGERVSLDH